MAIAGKTIGQQAGLVLGLSLGSLLGLVVGLFLIFLFRLDPPARLLGLAIACLLGASVLGLCGYLVGRVMDADTANPPSS
jgi:hypothetical protein